MSSLVKISLSCKSASCVIEAFGLLGGYQITSEFLSILSPIRVPLHVQGWGCMGVSLFASYSRVCRPESGNGMTREGALPLVVCFFLSVALNTKFSLWFPNAVSFESLPSWRRRKKQRKILMGEFLLSHCTFSVVASIVSGDGNIWKCAMANTWRSTFDKGLVFSSVLLSYTPASNRGKLSHWVLNYFWLSKCCLMQHLHSWRKYIC